MTYEIVLRIIEILLQLILIVIAWRALLIWKLEIRGRDRYKLHKDLLEYIKKLRFLVHGKGNTFHQIYLNDILFDRKKFYEEQLAFISEEKVYFDRSFFYLFDHINTRSDIFLPKQIRIALEKLYPDSATFIDNDKNKYTYIQLDYVGCEKNKNIKDGIYFPHLNGDITIKKYFEQWEKLIKELQKYL